MTDHDTYRTDQTGGATLPGRGTLAMIGMAREFLRMEAAGGIMLVIAAALALIVANSPLYAFYDFILNDVDFTIGFVGPENGGPFLQKSVLHWINDGLMAVFFFLVGLEIKREVLRGELASKDRALLPLVMAVGGVALPASIYYMLNLGEGGVPHGWAVPAATDIAFSLGVLALLGSRAPLSLKVMLTAIAIIDDLMAILIIAFFYSGGVALIPLVVAVCAALVLMAFNRTRVMIIAPYILVGFVLWTALLKSGVHPTIGGVLTAFAIPLSCPKRPWLTPVETLEHALHPWVSYMILPVFAFANAGVSFAGLGFDYLFHPVTLGIAAGLFIGKQCGVFVPLFLMVKSGYSRLPEDAGWLQLYGMAVLCGIGFTMSLFIGELAFDDHATQSAVRLGVLGGSLLSAVTGYLVIRFATKSK